MLSDFLTRIGDFLDYLNNYIQFFLLASAVLAGLWLFTLPYVRPLLKLLSPLGLTLSETIRVLWVCYKRPRTLIRVYIELALIRTKGYHQSALWWQQFQRIFKRFIDDQESSGVFIARISTCFDVTHVEFYEQVKTYFEYFKQHKASNKFGIPIDEPISFIIQIEINEGFIVPLTFITGLNDRFNEDWEKILGNYFTAFIDEVRIEDKVLPEELYFTFNWLMWGPSYQIDYSPNKYKLIQYGFGDESNSLNVILRNDSTGTRLWDRFCQDGDASGKKFGYNSMIRGRLYDTADYYHYRRENIEIKAMSFLKRLSEDSLGVSYLLELDDYEISHNLRADNYFFSAYIWIMFVLVDQTELSFNPQKSVTFFEHANIANSGNFNFLAETLVDKCFKHFDYISSHPELRKRKYQLCLTMNTYVKDLFIKRLNSKYLDNNELSWYRTNLFVESPYSISEILDGLDNYFITKVQNYEISTVDFRNKKSVSVLCDFYAKLYFPEFGQSSGLSFNELINFSGGGSKMYASKIIVATGLNGLVCGGSVSIWLNEVGCGIIDTILVSSGARNIGVEKGLLFDALQFLRGEYKKSNKKSINFVLARISQKSFERDSDYLKFWTSNGFTILDEVFNEGGYNWAVLPLGNASLNIEPDEMANKVLEEFSKVRHSLSGRVIN